MLLSVELAVESFRREHVTVILTDEIRLIHIGCNILLRLASCCLSIMGKVVKRIYVFQKRTVLQIPYARSLTVRIQIMRGFIRLLIKLIAVNGFIDPDAPQYYRRMITVLRYHFTGIDNRLLFPRFIADILPAGDLGKYEEAQFITSVYEVM